MSSYELTMLSRTIDARSRSDRRLYFLTDGILLPIITLGIWGLVLWYRLIKRRDEHFRRESALNHDLVGAIKERVKAAGLDLHTLGEVADLESAVRQKEEQEQAKGAPLWLILSLLTLTGIAALYVAYFVTVDYFHHEQRELDIVEKANAVLRRLGSTTAMPYGPVLPERHYWLNLLATILTLGIWGIVWAYRYLSDPNRHFENQWAWEDSLTASLSS